MRAPSRMSLGSPPRRPHRTIVILTASTTPSASSSPYTWIDSGPISIVPFEGLGIEARNTT